MKKTLLKLLLCVTLLAVICFGGCSCGGSSWDGSKVTLKTITNEVGVQGGMVAETENYVYFINGKADAEGDNTLGTPVKGALYAADKSDLTKQSIVVPKLFVASDYSAGVYIYGGYAYYGTPSTDKNSSGDIAKDELVFAKTKLDGTDTTVLFNAGAISTEYRIVKGADNCVYVVYYDSEDQAIKSYNTVSGVEVVVAKTNEQAKSESLKEYKFMTNEGINDAVVYFTTDIYSAEYNEEEAESEDYARSTYAYNKVYAYKAGDAISAEGAETYGVNVLNGDKAVYETYAISRVFNEYVQYTVTKNDGTAKTENYIIDGEFLYAKNFANALKVENAKYLENPANYLVVDLEEVYFVDTTNLVIMKTSLVGTKTEIEQNTAPVASVEAANTLYFVNNDYIYYANGTGHIARVYIGSDRADKTDELKEQIVSSDTTLTDWFAPKFISYTVGSVKKDYVFYANSGSEGLSYVFAVELNGEILAEDSDEDGENDKWSLKGNMRLGEMVDMDKAGIVNAKITGISSELDSSGRIEFDTDNDGNIVLEVKAIKEARELVDSYANTEVYDLIAEDALDLLVKYEKALEISKKLYALNGFSDKTDTEKQALESAYNDAKAFVEEFFNSDDSENHEDYTAVMDMVAKNLNYEYGKAKDFFEPAETETQE
ncbi:MAG: hypothetical protein IJY57_00960 [Clostridia bacterium]|nr:hypothetical protein [Clostridia bacterium]